jgi:hypothetical protein
LHVMENGFNSRRLHQYKRFARKGGPFLLARVQRKKSRVVWFNRAQKREIAPKQSDGDPAGVRTKDE